MDADWEDGDCAPSAGISDSGSGPIPLAIPAPDSPPLSEQLPSSQGPSEKHPDWNSSFVNKCEPPQAPIEDRAHYDKLTWGQLHDHCYQRGFDGRNRRRA